MIPSKRFVAPEGTVRWRMPNGAAHREDGPAVIFPDGSKKWMRHGEHHREDGPAIVHADGSEEWYLHNFPHRDDGPAVVDPDGATEWWLNGMQHRVDGPAIINADGSEQWCLHGKYHRTDGPATIDFTGNFRLWCIQDLAVDVEENRDGALDRERARMQQENFAPKEYDSFDPERSGLPDHSAQNVLYVKDHLDVSMLGHTNTDVVAAAAWHLPVDDDYLAAALARPFICTIMQYRDDVPDEIRELLQVAS